MKRKVKMMRKMKRRKKMKISSSLDRIYLSQSKSEDEGNEKED